jgi:hypothetical protein
VTESQHDGYSADVAPDDEPAVLPAVEQVDEAPVEPAVEPAVDGDSRVRDAVRRLDELSDLPPAEHVEIYESVHSNLQEALAEAAQQSDESPAEPNAPS